MVISRRLAFSVAAVTLLSGIMAAPVAAADPWQRSIRIRNDLPITIYSVINAVRNQNGPQCGSDSLLYRIIVNAGKKGAGIPTGQTVTVQLPKATPCWYNAVRLYLFSVDLATYETRISPDEQTVADGIQWNPPICPNDACWTGTAKTQYQIDAPAQLTEYTINSIDPATGMPFQNGNDTRGIPVVDLDLSFVDSVYLPVAIGLDDGGATQCRQRRSSPSTTATGGRSGPSSPLIRRSIGPTTYSTISARSGLIRSKVGITSSIAC